MTLIKESFAAKFGAGLVAVVMALSAMAPAVTQAQSTSIEDLLAQIAALQAQLTALNEGNTNVSSSSNTDIGVPCGYTFTRNLYLNSRGEDVMMMQKFLNSDPATAVAVVGVGSKGNETSFFGNLSRKAVVKYQLAEGITPAAGYFYPITRASVNAKIAAACANGGGDDEDEDDDVSSDEDELNVDGGDQPQDMAVGEGQKFVPTTVVEMTAGSDDVEVVTVTVEVTGNGQDGVDEVSAWVDGKVVDVDSVDSDDEAELTLNLSIEDGETVEVTIAASMENDLSDEDGLEFMIEVVEVETDGADVDGLPVDGAEHQIRDSLEINTYSVEIDDEGGEVQVGDDDELLATVTVTNENRDVNGDSVDDESIYVTMLVVEHVGSADLGDLDNVMVVDEDGEEYDVDVTGDYLMVDFGSGVEIEENDEMEFEIRGDIEDGAGDDISFALDNDDLEEMFMVVDEDDRYLAEYDGSVNVDADAIDILAGDGSSSESDDINDNEIAVGQEDAYFASFDMDIEGEDVEGDVTVIMTITDSTNNNNSDVELDNIRIVDENGNEVASSDDEDFTGTLDGSTTTSVTYTLQFEDVLLEEGDDQLFFIVADVSDDVDNGTTYEVTNINFASFEGETSGDDADDLNADDISLSVTQTVEGAVLAAGVDSSLEDDETKDDDDGVEIAVIQLDATASGEDIEVNDISLAFTLADAVGATLSADDISNCVLYDDGDEVSDQEDLDNTTLNETETFDMDAGFMVESNTVKALSLRCDLSDEFDTGDTIEVIVATDGSDADVDAESENENNIAVSFGDNTPATLTVVDATITVSNDAEPDMETAAAGTGEMVTIGFVEIDNEDVSGEVEEIGLEITNRSLLNSERKVMIYSGDDKVGEAYFTSNNILFDDFGVGSSEDLVLEDDKSIVLEFRATLASNVTTEGLSISVNIDGDEDIRVAGDDYDVNDTTLTGVTVYSGLPAFTISPVTDIDLQDNIVMKFTIAAEGDDLELSFADVSAAISIATTGSASYASGTEALYTGGSYSDAADESDEVTDAEVILISENSTEYFVVKADTVSEGETGDIIETRVNLTSALEVESTTISPVEGTSVNNDEEIVYKYTN